MDSDALTRPGISRMPGWRDKGFTLIELLVVIGIIALLMALLSPVLGHSRQAAYRINCGANLRSIGLALQLYEQDFPVLPPQYDRWGPVPQTYQTQFLEPWISYVAYHQDEQDEQGHLKPLQLATLITTKTLATPEVLYCPGLPRDADHELFTYNYVTDHGRQRWGEFIPTKTNGQPDDKIRTSYHYWLYDHRTLTQLTTRPVVFDNIQHWNSLSHQRGGNPLGVNALFGDGHVMFQSQRTLFDPNLWNGGPAAGAWDGPGNDQALFLALLNDMHP